MITIKQASPADISTIQEIARKTWPDTYGTILSSEQLEYMLDKFYSDESLNNNFQNNQLFFIVYENDIPLGFAGIEHHYLGLNKTRIHKIYILPTAHGKGIGNLLLTKIETLAQQEKSTCLNLNVNRFNEAVGFYKKQGFKIIKEYDLEIGNGYLMEDFEMEKKILNI
jgi:diamine N-acetyltransferase